MSKSRKSDDAVRRDDGGARSTPWLLAFGAHPDDIEFGCGAVIARETAAGRGAHLVVCSRGESGTHGTPAIRTREARAAAAALGATIEFVDLGGDAHFEISVARVLQLAAIVRRVRPAVLLAPTTVENQHPDHVRLGHMVRDAARLARYGGVKELRQRAPHAVAQVLSYAVTPEAEPTAGARILVDVSPPEIVGAWTQAMAAHASQMKTRNYVELQLTRARLNGLRAGVEHAVPLFAADAIVVESLAELGRGARRF
jgi:LmbE family N-acetylglucosaminyl deacetylase